MKVTGIDKIGTWFAVKGACLNTIGKDKEVSVEPNGHWKKNLLLSEHSPIRKLHFSWKWKDLPYWVSVHMTRHKFGIEHWVTTQRSDRTGINRENSPQGELVMHECEANAQALINISRKRLCHGASVETREAWLEVKNEVATVDAVMASVMVKECIYRGFCPELNSCGYYKTSGYRHELQQYRDGINQ